LFILAQTSLKVHFTLAEMTTLSAEKNFGATACLGSLGKQQIQDSSKLFHHPRAKEGTNIAYLAIKKIASLKTGLKVT